MADETVTFAIKLRDETSGPAQQASKSVADLKAEYDEATKALREMQAVQRALKGTTAAGSAAAKELATNIAAAKEAAGAAAAAYQQAGGATALLTQAQQGVAEASGEIPGPLGKAVSLFQRLGSVVKLGPVVAFAALVAAVVAVVAAVAAVVAAVAAGTVALGRYALASSEARRNELLHLEALTRMRRMFGAAQGTGEGLQQAIDAVSDSSSLGREEIGGYAQSLYRTGLRGGALQNALEGMAIAGAAGGELLANRFRGMAVSAARMGRSVADVTNDMRARFGDLANAQAMGFDTQMRKLRENFGRIFDGIDLNPFLRGLRQVTSLFGQNTASGRALRQIVTGLFQPLFNGVGEAGPLVRRFFQGAILAAQRLYIRYLDLRIALVEAFGGRAVLGSIDTLTLALDLGRGALYGLAAAAGVTLLALVGLGAAFAALTAPIWLPILALNALAFLAGRALRDLVDTTAAAGLDLMAGLGRGLRDGARNVLKQIRDLAGSITGTFRNVLQIRSPSRVFARLGAEIPRGLEVGIDRGAPRAQGAAEAMVAAPDAPSGSAQRRGGGVTVSIGEIHVNGSGRDAAQSIVDELVRLLEGVQLEMGGAR